MVRLTKIYTKTGDGGTTRLGDMSEVPKTHPRIEAYGTVDELNAALAMALCAPLADAHRQLLFQVQNDLFDLGADLCCPESGDDDQRLRINASQVESIEEHIDRINAALEPLKSFVLPGGSEGAAGLHMARAICRRAERCTWVLAQIEPLNPQALTYLNRLSDLLFVMSRAENSDKNGDVLWQPGKHQQSSKHHQSSKNQESSA